MSKRFHVDPNETIDVYEFDPAETLSDTPPNVVTIRARMDVATDGAVKSELVRLGKDGQTIESHVGENLMALLVHNIRAWRGPDFDDLPCTPANIRALPSVDSDPFLEKVANEIAARNRRPQSPKAGSNTSNTSGSAGDRSIAMPPRAGADRAPSLSERLILKQALPSGSDGRLKPSDD